MPFSRCSPKLHRSLLHSRFFHQNPKPNPNPPLDSVGPLACRLATRSVIRFRGPDTVKFLQGLLTNDVRPLAAPLKSTSGDRTPPPASSYLTTPNVPFRAPPPIYAALLTPQGRFLYDLFLYMPPSGEVMLDRTGSGPGSDNPEEPFALMADVDAEALDEVLDFFKK